MTIDHQWVRSAVRIAVVIEAVVTFVSLAVGMFGHLMLMFFAALVIGVVMAVIGIIEHNTTASWRLHHVELWGFSVLLMTSMLAHADRPVHVVVCLGLLLVLHCSPERLLRHAAGFGAATLLALGALLPFSLLQYYGASDSLTIVYRISTGIVMVPFLMYTRAVASDVEFDELTKFARNYKMTPEEREAQRRSFAYGNAKIDNPHVTMEMVDEAAEKIRKEES